MGCQSYNILRALAHRSVTEKLKKILIRHLLQVLYWRDKIKISNVYLKLLCF